MPKAKIIFSDYDEAAGIETKPDGSRIVDIHEFDLNKMWPLSPDDTGHGVKICITAKPGRGKTRIMEQIMLYKSWICPIAQVYSGTESSNGFYSQKVTPVTIFNEMEPKQLESLAKRQSIAQKYLPNPWAMLVIDDCIDSPNVLKNHPHPAFFRKGRHMNVLRCDISQYPMDLPAGIRSCIDYLFIPQNSLISERQKLYENFASGAIPSFKDFCDLMDQVTGDYCALVIDNTSTSQIISERIFYFKADLNRVPPDFKVGCPDAWTFSEERMDPNYQESFL
jgi:hypothetical protein